MLKARAIEDGSQAAFAPVPVEEVVAAIEAEKPDVVFAPHVETSAGMILPDDYMRKVAEAVHAAGGLFVLDSLPPAQSGCMADIGIDVLIGAEGWSASRAVRSS